MFNTSIVLFPHSIISEHVLKKILALFGNMTICIPWLMDEFLKGSPAQTDPRVTILYPPEKFRPDEKFKDVMNEYRQWGQQTRISDVSAYIHMASKTSSTFENTASEIRQSLSDMNKKTDNSMWTNALKYQTILQLAASHEKCSIEVSEMLGSLKSKSEPLADAIGDNTNNMDTQNWFSQNSNGISFKTQHMDMIFDAWFCLFEEYHTRFETFVTFNKQFFDHSMDIFENNDIMTYSGNVETLAKDQIKVKGISATHLPKIPATGNINENRILRGLSDKTIVLLEEYR